MAIKSRALLQLEFQTGDKPKQQDFYDWLDSFVHKNEDEKLLGLKEFDSSRSYKTLTCAIYNGDLWQVQEDFQGAFDETKWAKLTNLNPGSGIQLYDNAVTYEVTNPPTYVEYKKRIFRPVQTTQGNPPIHPNGGVNTTYWTEISTANKTFGDKWINALYWKGQVVRYNNRLWELVENTPQSQPFHSTDIAGEIVQGKWIEISPDSTMNSDFIPRAGTNPNEEIFGDLEVLNNVKIFSDGGGFLQLGDSSYPYLWASNGSGLASYICPDDAFNSAVDAMVFGKIPTPLNNPYGIILYKNHLILGLGNDEIRVVDNSLVQQSSNGESLKRPVFLSATACTFAAAVSNSVVIGGHWEGYVVQQNDSVFVPYLFAKNDIELMDSNYGLILKAPGGGRWRLQVDNTGVLTTTAV